MVVKSLVMKAWNMTNKFDVFRVKRLKSMVQKKSVCYLEIVEYKASHTLFVYFISKTDIVDTRKQSIKHHHRVQCKVRCLHKYTNVCM